MSASVLAVREADRKDEADKGYLLIVTMSSGRVYRGASRRCEGRDGAHAVDTLILEVNEQDKHGLESRTLYLNERAIECVEVEYY